MEWRLDEDNDDNASGDHVSFKWTQTQEIDYDHSESSSSEGGKTLSCDEDSMKREQDEGDDREQPLDETMNDYDGETEDVGAAALEKDLLAVCNGLHILRKNESENHPSVTLGQETLLNLQDVMNILSQSRQTDSNGKRDLTAESLLINPKYEFINTTFMPLWEACLDTPEESEYLDRLMFIFARVLIPPDETWKYANISHRVRWYILSIQSLKPAFLRPGFWKGLAHSQQRLLVIHERQGRTSTTEQKKNELFQELQILNKQAETLSVQERQNIICQREEFRNKIKEIEDEWVKRREYAKKQLLLLKILVVALLRLPPPLEILEQQDIAFGASSEFSRMVASYIAQYVLWNMFEADWRELLAKDLFLRSQRRVINGKAEDTATLWRLLDFYSSLLGSFPPNVLINVALAANTYPLVCNATDNVLATTSSKGPIFLRHNRFNPFLVRRRVEQFEGAYLHKQKSDHLYVNFCCMQYPIAHRGRTTLYRKKKTQITGKHILSSTIKDVALRPGASEMSEPQSLKAYFTEESTAAINDHIQEFIRLAFNRCLAAWFADCNAEDAILTQFDSFKVINFMAWVLCYKRHWLQHKRTIAEEEQGKMSDAERKEVLSQIVQEVLTLRSALETQGIFFVHGLFHDQVKKRKLRNESDTLARFCLRALVEQLRFGAFLMRKTSLTVETLSVVGQCIVEDLFKCNVTEDITWCLKNMRPYTQEPDFILYVYEITFLLLRAFTSLGGAATVVLPKRRGGSVSTSEVTTENETDRNDDNEDTAAGVQIIGNRNIMHEILFVFRYHSVRRARRLELQEFVAGLFDGRIICNIMKSLERYKSNPPVINTCLVRILLSLTRDREAKSQHTVVLFFQLSYFHLFIRILQDKSLLSYPDGRDLRDFAYWVVSEFWNVFQRNRFVVVELFFGKCQEAATQIGSYSDPEVLLSVYTNYERGLDHEFIQNFDEQDTHDDIEEWKRKLESERRQTKTAWTAEENRMLMRLWELKRKLPHFISQIRRGLKTKRSAKAIATQLQKLRIIELEEEESKCSENPEDENESFAVASKGRNPLMEALLKFRLSLDISACWTTPCPAELTPNDKIAHGLLNLIKEVRSLKVQQSRKNYIVDLPRNTSLQILKLPEFKNLMLAMNAVQLCDERQQHLLETCVNTEAPQESDFWYISKSTSAQELTTRIQIFEAYMLMPTKELELALQASRIDNANARSSRLMEELSKIQIMGLLAAMKAVEFTQDQDEDVLFGALVKDVYTILKDIDQCVDNIIELNNDQDDNCQKNRLIEAAESVMIQRIFGKSPSSSLTIKDLQLPDYVSVTSVASAVAAAMENIYRRRKQYILAHGIPPSQSDILNVGELSFPQQSPNDLFAKVVHFVLNSTHPLLVSLLHCLGFHRWTSTTVGHDDSLKLSNDGRQISPHRWVISVNQSLQKLDIDLRHLRAYTMTPIGRLITSLKRLSKHADTAFVSSSEKTPPHVPRQQQRIFDVPLLEVNELSDSGLKAIINGIRKLRIAEHKGGLDNLLSCVLKKVLNIIEDWCTVRIERHVQFTCGDDEDDEFHDLDLVLTDTGVNNRTSSSTGHEEKQESHEGSNKDRSNRIFKTKDGNDVIIHEHILGETKGTLELQRCLYALLGRPTNITAPQEWHWSRGCNPKVVVEHIKIARVAFDRDLKLLKKFVKGKLSITEIISPTVHGQPEQRFDTQHLNEPVTSNMDEGHKETVFENILKDDLSTKESSQNSTQSHHHVCGKKVKSLLSAFCSDKTFKPMYDKLEDMGCKTSEGQSVDFDSQPHEQAWSEIHDKVLQQDNLNINSGRLTQARAHEVVSPCRFLTKTNTSHQIKQNLNSTLEVEEFARTVDCSTGVNLKFGVTSHAKPTTDASSVDVAFQKLYMTVAEVTTLENSVVSTSIQSRNLRETVGSLLSVTLDNDPQNMSHVFFTTLAHRTLTRKKNLEKMFRMNTIMADVQKGLNALTLLNCKGHHVPWV